MNKRNSVTAKNKPEGERARVSLVLPAGLKAALIRAARQEVRTLNQQCEVLLRKGLDEMGIAI